MSDAANTASTSDWAASNGATTLSGALRTTKSAEPNDTQMHTRTTMR